VFLGVLLKVYVVEKSHDAPEILFVSKAQFGGVPFHHAFNSQGMLEVKGILVVLPQKFPGLIPGYGRL
jgi:hypothetical protein